LLTQTAEPARAIPDVETIDVVADRGYFKIEDIEACEKVELMPHVPKPQRGSSVRNGLFRKDEFRYDPDQDVYICPAGQTLSPNHEGKSRDLKKIDYSNPAACPPVRCVRAARPICAGSRVWRTRRCSTAWQPV
jgi:transposase